MSCLKNELCLWLVVSTTELKAAYSSRHNQLMSCLKNELVVPVCLLLYAALTSQCMTCLKICATSVFGLQLLVYDLPENKLLVY